MIGVLGYHADDEDDVLGGGGVRMRFKLRRQAVLIKGLYMSYCGIEGADCRRPDARGL